MQKKRSDITKENIKEHTPNWSQILDHLYRTVKIGGSGSGKSNLFFNLINQQLDTGQIYLYARDPYEANYQFLVDKRENTGLKYLNDSKTFIEYSNDMGYIYRNIEEYNPKKIINYQKLIISILNCVIMIRELTES